MATPSEQPPASLTDLRVEARLRLLFMDAPVAIAVLRGPEHLYVLTNARYQEMLQRTSLEGRTVAQAFPEVVGTPLMQVLDRVFQTGEPFFTDEYTTSLVRDGSGVPRTCYFEFNLAATRDADRHIDGMMCTAVEVTERVEARRRVEASRDQLSALFDQMPALVGVVNAKDGRFSLANPSLRQMVGNRELVGRTRKEALPELGPSGLLQALDDVIRTGQPFSARHFPVRVDLAHSGEATEGFFDITYQPVFEPGTKQIQSVVLFGVDVSEQVRGQRRAQLLAHELAESEQRFRLLATAGAHALWRTNARGEALELLGWTELTGQTAREWQGTGWHQAIHPEERSRVLASLEACAALQQPLRATFRLNRHSPEPWVTLEGVPVPGPDGDIAEWVGTLRDVTQAQRAEAALGLLVTLGETLSQSLELPAVLTAFAQAAVPLFSDWAVVDLLEDDGTMRRVTVAHADPLQARLAEELKAFPPSGNPEHLPSQGLRMQRAHLVEEYTDAMAQAGITDPHLLQLRRAMGIHSVLVVPLIARDRRVGVITFTTAESRRRFGESDRLLSEDLGRRLASAIDNARLFRLAGQERLRAEEANRTKDEFLAVVSHELRTPLTSMLGWLQMLRSGSLPLARQEKALETVERNARAQARLVEDLLDVSQIMTGKLRLEVELVNLAVVVEAAVEAVRPAADARGIRLKTALSTGTSVRGDPSRLQQVIWNLLSNAIKFTPRGGRVSVFLERVHSSVQLTVSDTGQGIPADFLPHVFEQFRQADTGSTRKHGGLGLGLSIVRHLVELHGGAVEAHSPGEAQGSTFLLQLPAAVLREGIDEQALPLLPVDGEHTYECPGELQGIKVLVVDDEQDTRELLASMLGRCGVVVTAVASAPDALAALSLGRFAAIVSDIGLPDEDGYSFIQKVRQLTREQGGQTPAIALTAYSRASDRRRALQAGFNMHVPKPIDPAELVVVLASVTAFQRDR